MLMCSQTLKILSALCRSKWFSVMDLESSYYQIEMVEEDKAKTAFVYPLGFYNFNTIRNSQCTQHFSEVNGEVHGGH